MTYRPSESFANKSNSKALNLSQDKDLRLYGLEYYAKKAKDKRRWVGDKKK